LNRFIFAIVEHLNIKWKEVKLCIGKKPLFFDLVYSASFAKLGSGWLILNKMNYLYKIEWVINDLPEYRDIKN
jgi:hypothetical protein